MANFITMGDVDRTDINISVATKVHRVDYDELWVYYGNHVERLTYVLTSDRDEDYYNIIGV